MAVRALLALALALALSVANGMKIYMNDLNSLVYEDNPGAGIRGENSHEESSLRTITRFIFESTANEFYRAPKIKNLATKGCVKSFGVLNKEFDGNLNIMNIEDGFSGELTLVMDLEYECTGEEGANEFSFELATYKLRNPDDLDLEDIGDIALDLDDEKRFNERFQSKNNITFTWTKKCSKKAVHTGVNVDIEGEDQAVVNGVPEPEFVYSKDNDGIYTVEKYATSTVIYMSASDGTSFSWGKPKIEATHTDKKDKIKMHSTGPLSAPGYVHSEDQSDPPSLVLFYDECDAESVVVRVTWDIPGFSPVYIEFIKRCGSKVHTGLSIKMSSPTGVRDVVVNGKVLDEFVTGKFLLSSSVQGTTFWVSTASAPVTISRVVVFQSPTTFRSSLVGAITPNSAYTISDTSSVALNFDCSVQGTSKTTVTFILDGYDQLDVSFSKQCSPKNAKLKSKQSSPKGSIYGTSWLVL